MADSLSTSQTSGPGSPSDFVPHISTSDDELHPSLPTVPDTGTDRLKQPVTPTRDSRIVDEVQGATPGSAKASAQQTLALKSVQGKQARPDWRKRLNKEMKDILVQMPFSDFLQRFVRGKEPTAEIKAKLAEIKLNKDKFTVQERHMYNDLCEFINTISDICSEGGASGLKLVAKDTGANPDTSIGGDGSKNKPDVSIFPERDETHATCQPAMKAKKSTAKKRAAKKSTAKQGAAKQGAANAKQAQTPFKAATSWHRASLVIECKSSDSDGHPFSFRPASTSKSTKTSGTSAKSTKTSGTSDKSTKAPGTSDKECDSAAPNPQAEKDVFLPQADEAIKSRGQLSDYAMHLMRSQPRQFCFMVVVAGCYARIMRWDRSGAIVSEAFEFVEDPSTMVTFLYNYMTMTQEERGFDMSVVEASDDDKKEMIAWKDRMVQDKELSDYHTERFKEAMETKWPIYKVTIPREDLISAAELEPKADEAGAPKDSSQSGSDIHTEDLTLLIGKPLSMSNSPTGRSTIGYVAFDMRGKRLVFLRDSWPLDSPLRKTERTVYKDLWQNGVKYIARPISGGIVKNGDKIHRTITQKYGDTVQGTDTRARIHFRLITDEVYEPLDNCKCSYELILVLSDAITGKANIMLKRIGLKAGDVVGILIDWDLCKYEVQLKTGSSNPAHSGTWQFSSAMLLRYPMKLRQVSDDLESFVHVLHWMILMWYEHSLSESPAALQEVVLDTYDKFSDTLGYDTGGDKKFNYMRLGELPFADLSSTPLKALTETLAEICEEHYNASSTKQQIAKLEEIKKQRLKKNQSQSPAAPVELEMSARTYDLAKYPKFTKGATAIGKKAARPLLDTSAEPKLQDHDWILGAFTSVLVNMGGNRFTPNDKLDSPQFTPATESATQQSMRGQKRPSQSSGESTRSSKKAKTTHGTRTMSSSMGTIFEEDEHSGGET
ncbi:predicted protein [Postia placenta Mad-698-R]|nr:predicted protein [Postia placenta Mad-698-R]